MAAATATASVATSFTPLHDRILVRRVEEGESSRGGIIIPDTAKEKPQEGEVISVGKGKSNDEGKVFPLDVKAGDKILAVTIPPAANKLRRLMNLAQIIQSHALSFFHLSGPDLFLGMDSDPAGRNIFGLIATDPDFARRSHSGRDRRWRP